MRENFFFVFVFFTAIFLECTRENTRFQKKKLVFLLKKNCFSVGIKMKILFLFLLCFVLRLNHGNGKVVGNCENIVRLVIH